MGSCSAFKCTNRAVRGKVRTKNRKLSFHRFPDPIKEKTRRAQWIQAVQQAKRVLGVQPKPWIPSSNCRLCSDHFEEKHFITSNNKRYLKFTAIPSIFNIPLFHPSQRRKQSNKKEPDHPEYIAVDTFDSEENETQEFSQEDEDNDNEVHPNHEIRDPLGNDDDDSDYLSPFIKTEEIGLNEGEYEDEPEDITVNYSLDIKIKEEMEEALDHNDIADPDESDYILTHSPNKFDDTCERQEYDEEISDVYVKSEPFDSADETALALRHDHSYNAIEDVK